MQHEWPMPQPDPAKANTREEDIRTVTLAEYGEHGDWARHYSTVRMTLGTFFVTAATGIITLRWDTPDPGIALIAGLMVLIGLAVFWIFTAATVTKMNEQLDIVNAYRSRLYSGATKIQPKRLTNLTALPIGIAIALLLIGFDIWWLCASKPAHVATPTVVVQPNSN